MKIPGERHKGMGAVLAWALHCGVVGAGDHCANADSPQPLWFTALGWVVLGVSGAMGAWMLEIAEKLGSDKSVRSHALYTVLGFLAMLSCWTVGLVVFAIEFAFPCSAIFPS